MKKKTAIILTIICLLTVILPACKSGGESGPQELPSVNVCVDMRNTSGVSKLLTSTPGNGEKFNIIPKIIPAQGEERNGVLTRLRVEIMAGKGPDMFICECPAQGQWLPDGGQGLFPLPKQLMENRTFLPLDSYIENAEYTDWDRLLPAVMESGRNDEGQLLVPMAYRISAVLYDKDDYTPPEDLPNTYAGMRQSSDPVIRTMPGGGGLAGIMGELADYEKDEPAFTEEELLETAMLINTRIDIGQDGEEAAIPEREYVLFDRSNDQIGISLRDTDYVMLPNCNNVGGITAEVSAYAAINRNTKCPGEAFKVMDFLLSRGSQQSSDFYTQNVSGMPVDMDIGGSEAPFSGPWAMSEANFREFQKLREQISAVNYPGPLDEALLEVSKITPCTQEEMEKKVHEQYVLIKMLLAES